MEANTKNTAFDSLGASVSKAVDTFRKSKEIKIWVIGIIIVGILGYFAYKSIKKSGLDDIPLPDLPDSDTPIPDEEGYRLQAESRAKKVRDVTSGLFTAAGVKEGVFQELYKLDDRALVYTYRTYTTLFFKKYQETMTQAIADEWNVFPEWEGGVSVKLVNRLTLLGAT